jgi:hypothetical protein
VPLTDRKPYQQYVVKLSGKDYLMVVGQMKAAHDAGVFMGSETISVEETETHLRVGVRAFILNRHLVGDEGIPQTSAFLISSYDGFAQAPKTDGPNDKRSPAQKKAPLEDLETSALGRALSKAGFALDTMATADEIILANNRETGGYELELPPRKRLSEQLKASGIKSKAAAEKAAQDKFEKTLDNLTDDEVQSWLVELQKAEPVPF